MTAPRATVRLQLHSKYTLRDASREIPYYADLGISHLYLSPVSRARPGSGHGYDVVDPRRINPELGDMAALEALAGAARAHRMGLILDIVPNHMATHPDNPWWWDVLQHGARSAHARWFDIDWHSPVPGLDGKILAPFLPEDYGRSLASGIMRLRPASAGEGWCLDVGGTPYPLAEGSLDTAGSRAQVLARHDPHSARGREALHAVLERQHYRLCWWRCAADLINWRRFFEITDLIGLCVERDEVFEAVHALPLELYQRGLIDGVRIDHVDGLAEPLAYCRRLRRELRARVPMRPDGLRGDPPWIIIEKILAQDEELDDRWQADGTTGYDFMNDVSAVLHDGTGLATLTRAWTQAAPEAPSFAPVLAHARRLMLERHFVAERARLLRMLQALAMQAPETRDWSAAAMARVLDEVLIAFPVYRTYVEEGNHAPSDARWLGEALRAALLQQRGERDGNEEGFIDVLAMWLARHGPLRRRFQQLTPPLAAKSMEDTSFYRYGRLLSRNEVGADPACLSITPSAFHERNQRRALSWTRAMLSTATHDQKRGEDARMRLALLSETAAGWAVLARRWMHDVAVWPPVSSEYRPGERYMLLQTVLGSWPLDLDVGNQAGLDAYTERLVQWQAKALREAKQSTSWMMPDQAYEHMAEQELRALMQGPDAALRHELFNFLGRLAPCGATNSLAQTVLRLTVPGIPDLYQGREYWDFSLVDPDNRRPVDHEERRLGLKAWHAESKPDELLAEWRSGRIKQAVIAACLHARRSCPQLWAQGSYLALETQGKRSRNILAFARGNGPRNCLLAVVPRLCAHAPRHQPGKESDPTPLVTPQFWEDTAIRLPAAWAGLAFNDLLSGRTVSVPGSGLLRITSLLQSLPVSVLLSTDSM